MLLPDARLLTAGEEACNPAAVPHGYAAHLHLGHNDSLAPTTHSSRTEPENTLFKSTVCSQQDPQGMSVDPLCNLMPGPHLPVRRLAVLKVDQGSADCNGNAGRLICRHAPGGPRGLSMLSPWQGAESRVCWSCPVVQPAGLAGRC